MPRGIYTRTKEQIEKLVKRNKLGLSIKSRKKISKSLEKQWAGGKRESPMKDKKHSEETKKKMKESSPKFWLGKHLSESHKKNVGDGNRGKEISVEHREKLSEALKGEKSYLWQGGITKENDKIRKNLEIKLWKKAVFERDNFTCQECKSQKSGNFNAHHIKNFAEYPELRTSIENGITFCKKCHKKFHDKYGYKNNNREQLEEFLCQK